MRAKWGTSVRSRATSWASVVLALALVVGALAAAGQLRRALASDEASLLDDRVDEVEVLVRAGALTSVLAPTGREVGQVQVVDSSGTVVAVTPGLAVSTRLDVITAPPAGEQKAATVDGRSIGGVPGDRYRVVARTVPSPVGPLTIYAVTSLDAADRASRHLRNALLISVPLEVILAAWLISRVVARALAPVDSMRAEVDRIEAADLSGRVQAGSSDDEIARLGLTLNRMLDRLEEASSRQRLFAAAASHELRSPLSTIRTELEVGLAYPDRAEWPKVAEDSLIEVARLEELTRDLRILTRSRSMQVAAATPIELSEVVAAEVALRRPERQIHYRTELAEAEISADPDAVVRVVRNLFDNAERHAASAIRVTVSSEGGVVTLSVWNDGPKIPAGDLERIFEPFMRLDEARSLDTGGTGLGLAIARSIMTALGGSIGAVDVMRGAEFRVTFPSRSPVT
ncbi:MAG: sensor histidine kinase [Ilumatobacteraceae bacterium]